jgi:hypothetical protein
MVKMSESYGTTPSASGAGTTDVAKQEARATAEQVKEGGRHLADVGKDEARNVTSEAGQQARQLWEQTRSEMADQGAQQQQRAAQGLRSLSGELRSMAHGSQQNGIATDLATQASQQVEEIARWLEDREPGAVLEEVKGFARRRPGLFLAGAAALGVLGGRLSRGLVAEHQDTSGADSLQTPPAVDHSTTGYSAYGSPTATPAVPAGGTTPVRDPAGSDLVGSDLGEPGLDPDGTLR